MTENRLCIEKTYDPHSDPCVTLIEAIADGSGRNKDDIGPVYDVIDSDAVARIFGRGDPPDGTELTFPFEGFWVTIYASGEVTITERSSENTNN